MPPIQSSQTPQPRREIESLRTETGLNGWSLRTGNNPAFRLLELSPWRWELCKFDGDPFEPRRILNLEVETAQNRFWPRETALDEQIAQVRTVGGEWLADLLPWTPYLIVGSCREENQTKRKALLTLLFLNQIPNGDPGQGLTLFRLHALAYESLMNLFENESGHRSEMEAALHRVFSAWQEEILSDERSRFFGQGMPTLFSEEHRAEGRTIYRVYALEKGEWTQSRRERAMGELLLTGSANGESLRVFFHESAWGWEVVRALIQRWFLPRYDLDMAERLKVAVQTDGRLAGWAWPARIAVNGLRFGLVLALLYGVFFWRFMPDLQRIAGAWTEWLVWGLSLLVYGILAAQVIHWLRAGAPDTSLPRLRAGMFVGVVGTLLQQNWNGLLAFSLHHPYALGALCTVLFLIAWQVLRAKVAATIGPEAEANRWRSWLDSLATRRCWAVFWRAGALAFLLSFILIDFLSDSYLGCGTSKEITCSLSPIAGIVGGTYPSLVLLFSAILLFAGIFGQLLWDEKPMTEALA